MASRARQRIVFIAELVLLSACTRQPVEPVGTVSYFQAHPEERIATVARCADDPGRLGKTPNCENAKQATAIEDIGSFEDLAPLNLGEPKRRPTGQDHPGRDAQP